MVPARLSVLTIGARNLPPLRDFYKAIGWPLVVDLDDFAAFQTRGAVFTLYALDNLVADTNAGGSTSGAGFNGVTPAVNVDDREQVDETIQAAREAGAQIVKQPTDMDFGGRSAYFSDPEGNYWEVAWVPPESKVAQAIRKAGNLD